MALEHHPLIAARIALLRSSINQIEEQVVEDDDMAIQLRGWCDPAGAEQIEHRILQARYEIEIMRAELAQLEAGAVAQAVAPSQPLASPTTAEQQQPAAAAAPRWGSREQAAAVLGMSEDSLRRMRAEQRRRRWTLPGDPVIVGRGPRRRHEQWDLDRVVEWAQAYAERQAQAPAPRKARRRARPSSASEEGSLVARVTAARKR